MNNHPLLDLYVDVLSDWAISSQHYAKCRKDVVNILESIITATCINITFDDDIREYTLIRVDLHKLEGTAYWEYVKNNMKQRYHVIDAKHIIEEVLPDIIEHRLDPLDWVVTTLVERKTEY